MSPIKPLKEMLKQWAPMSGDILTRAGIHPGLYHWMVEADGAYTRFHLRVDRDGQGLLLANATAAARLTPSGVIIAKGILEGVHEQTLLRRLLATFRDATPHQAGKDIERVRRLFSDLKSPGDNYPILNLFDPIFSDDALSLEKPLSADLPVASTDRLSPLLDRLWELGIPHVTFLAQEKADERDLVRAVERAEDLGMIAGVRTRGSFLANGTLLGKLAQAGLDHLDVLYLSSNSRFHDSLAGPGDHEKATRSLGLALDDEVCGVAEIVLMRENLETIAQTMESIAALGVRIAAFVGIAAAGETSDDALSPVELVQAAELVRNAADDFGMRLLWYPPATFDVNVALWKQVRRLPRCSGATAVRVELDGSVIPATGSFQPVGNILVDPWETIAGRLNGHHTG